MYPTTSGKDVYSLLSLAQAMDGEGKFNWPMSSTKRTSASDRKSELPTRSSTPWPEREPPSDTGTTPSHRSSTPNTAKKTQIIIRKLQKK